MITENVRVPEGGIELSRRGFVASAIGGFALGFCLPGGDRFGAAEAADPNVALNAYIRISTDESITILFGGCEFGQGSMSGLCQIAAEELKVEYDAVRPKQADAGAISYLTGGSSAIRGRFDTLRKAGATAREMLISAGAAAMAVDRSSCQAINGRVVATVNGVTQSMSYGQLATAAALQPIPAAPPLTDPDFYRVIGQSVDRFDIPSKVDGSAIYGLDVRLPNMVYAAVKHCPTTGGIMATKPAKPSAAIAVVPLKTIASRGAVVADAVNAIAVVADNSWKAMKLAKNLSVSWKLPPAAASMTTSAMVAQAKDLMANGPARVAETAGDVNGALAAAAYTIDSTYSLPYVAHACMEVLNCTVNYNGTTCEIWAPTQSANTTLNTAAVLTGLAKDKITVHTTLLGGGLGRKFEQDYIGQAVQVGMALKRPVKLMWSREEDFRNDQYRPMAMVRVQAGIDADGRILGWNYRNVSPSILGQRSPLSPTAVDSQAVEGAVRLHYAMDSKLTDWVPHPSGVPVGFWRSVGSSINAFAVESAIDELADAADIDPLAFRRALMAQDGRAVALLDAAAAISPWRDAPTLGRAWGMAFAESFKTMVCQIVEVSQPTVGAIRVHRVACAVDCGMAINPASVEAQLQGAIVHGLGAALWGQVTFANGVASARNFNNYRMPRQNDMPSVEIAIVNSGEALGGIGEPGVPPIAPAIANAWYRLTGNRVRSLPMFPSVI